MRIAVTSTNGETIDLHFGKAEEFYVFNVDKADETFTFLEKRAAVSIPEGVFCTGGSENALNVLTDLLSDCEYVLTQKVGIGPYKAFIKKGISVLESPKSLDLAVSKLCKYLNRKAGQK